MTPSPAKFDAGSVSSRMYSIYKIVPKWPKIRPHYVCYKWNYVLLLDHCRGGVREKKEKGKANNNPKLEED